MVDETGEEGSTLPSQDTLVVVDRWYNSSCLNKQNVLGGVTQSTGSNDVTRTLPLSSVLYHLHWLYLLLHSTRGQDGSNNARHSFSSAQHRWKRGEPLYFWGDTNVLNIGVSNVVYEPFVSQAEAPGFELLQDFVGHCSGGGVYGQIASSLSYWL